MVSLVPEYHASFFPEEFIKRQLNPIVLAVKSVSVDPIQL